VQTGVTKKLRQRKKKLSITLEELGPFLDFPMNQVAYTLGVSVDCLRSTCHRLGIPRWPSQFSHPAPAKSKISREELLKYSGLNRVEAAKTLGVGVSTLRRACRSLGITSRPKKLSSISREELLKYSGLNRVEAAKTLGVSVDCLRRTCRRLGITSRIYRKRVGVPFTPPSTRYLRSPNAAARAAVAARKVAAAAASATATNTLKKKKIFKARIGKEAFTPPPPQFLATPKKRGAAVAAAAPARRLFAAH
jgi:hypothetical protein